MSTVFEIVGQLMNDSSMIVQNVNQSKDTLVHVNIENMYALGVSLEDEGD
jgi:hypothetical protein